MADEKIQITLTLAGQKEINDGIKLLNQGDVTLQRLNQTQKAFQAAREKEIVGGKVYNRLLEEENKIRQYKIDLKQKETAAAGGLHAKYFELGTMIRQHIVDNLHLNGTMGTMMTKMSGLTSETTAATGAMKGLNLGAAGVAGAIIAAGIAVTGFIYKMKDFAMEGARMELLRNQLTLFANKDGVSLEQTIKRITVATGGQVSQVTMLQTMMKFRLADTSFGQMPELFAFIENRADQLNMSFEEVAAKLYKVEGGAKKAARELGLTFDTDEAEQEYANTLGKTADALTDGQKKAAFFAGAIKEAREQMATIAGDTMPVKDAIDEFNTSLDDLKTSASGLAGAFAPVWKEWALHTKNLTTVLNSLRNIFGGKKPDEKVAMEIPLPKDEVPAATATEKAKYSKWLVQQNVKTQKAILESDKDSTQAKLALLDLEKKDAIEAMKKEVAGQEMQAQAKLDIEKQFQAKKKAILHQAFLDELAMRVKQWDAEQKLNPYQQALAAGGKKQGMLFGKTVDVGKEKENAYGENFALQLNYKEFERTAKLGDQFVENLQSGLQNATSTLAQGFVKAFGLGQGMLDQMLASILGSLAQAGISSLLSMIPGIGPFMGAALGGLSKGAAGMNLTEPVVGLGKSGRAYMFGEDGPETVSPVNKLGQQGRFGGSASTNPTFIIKNEYTAAGFATVVERGNRINRRRRR